MTTLNTFVCSTQNSCTAYYSGVEILAASEDVGIGLSQGPFAHGQQNGSSDTLTFSTTNGQGLIILSVTAYASSGTDQLTANAGSTTLTFSLAVSGDHSGQNGTNGAGKLTAIYYAYASGNLTNEQITVTFSRACYSSICVQPITGAKGSSPVGVAVSPTWGSSLTTLQVDFTGVTKASQCFVAVASNSGNVAAGQGSTKLTSYLNNLWTLSLAGAAGIAVAAADVTGTLGFVVGGAADSLDAYALGVPGSGYATSIHKANGGTSYAWAALTGVTGGVSADIWAKQPVVNRAAGDTNTQTTVLVIEGANWRAQLIPQVTYTASDNWTLGIFCDIFLLDGSTQYFATNLGGVWFRSSDVSPLTLTELQDWFWHSIHVLPHATDGFAITVSAKSKNGAVRTGPTENKTTAELRTLVLANSACPSGVANAWSPSTSITKIYLANAFASNDWASFYRGKLYAQASAPDASTLLARSNPSASADTSALGDWKFRWVGQSSGTGINDGVELTDQSGHDLTLALGASAQFFYGGELPAQASAAVPIPAAMLAFLASLGGSRFQPAGTDGEGWTTLRHSSDSRLIYVDPSGSDTIGNFILGSNVAIGSARNGLPAGVTPVATFAKACTFLRAGYPDWILLKNGGTWSEKIGGAYSGAGGRSFDEPRVITSYGTGSRPVITPNSGGETVLSHTGATISSHIYTVGLELYDPRRDPASVAYEHDGSGHATSSDVLCVDWVDGAFNILFEDCFVHFLAGGLNFQKYTYVSPKNVRLRRCVIVDLYAINRYCQGTYCDTVDGFVAEECIFDHNSWNVQAGDAAGIYDHHIYHYNATNARYSRNLFLRAESLALKMMSRDLDLARGIAIEDNFFFEGEVGMSFSYSNTEGNTSAPGGGTCFTDLRINNNVLSQIDLDNPTGRVLGWGLQITTMGNADVRRNLFHDIRHAANNTYAISMAGSAASVCSGVHIEDNTIYGVAENGLVLSPQAAWTGNAIRGNKIQDAGLGSAVASVTGACSSLGFSGNTYSASNASKFAVIDGSNKTYAQWLTASGETGSSQSTISYPDPTRTLGRYVTEVLGLASLDAYYTALRGMSRTNWDWRYMAAAINDWIRGGFGL